MQAVAMEVGAANKQVYNMNFDSDSAKVGIDNRCSACMSHIIEDFQGPLTEYNRPIKGFGGTKTWRCHLQTTLLRLSVTPHYDNQFHANTSAVNRNKHAHVFCSSDLWWSCIRSNNVCIPW